MRNPVAHVTKCLVAGVVALLPLGGALLTIAWLENAISHSWRDQIGWYFPGLGLSCALLATYLVGLFVTTFAGRWLWRWLDRLLEGLPLVGVLYQSLKEVLGYDTAKAHFFQGVVAVPSDEGHEIGFITGNTAGPDGAMCTLVFVPGAPNPSSGRLLLVDPGKLRRLDVKTADALRALVSMGKTAAVP